jgi:hypothetical protein
MKDTITEQDLKGALQGQNFEIDRDYRGLFVPIDYENISRAEQMLARAGVFFDTVVQALQWTGSVDCRIRCYGWQRSLNHDAIKQALHAVSLPRGWNLEFKYQAWYLEWGALTPSLDWEVADLVGEAFPIEVKAAFDTVVFNEKRRLIIVVPHPKGFLPPRPLEELAMPQWQVDQFMDAVTRGVALLDGKIPNWRGRVDKAELSWADDRVPSTVLEQIFAATSASGRELQFLIPEEYERTRCNDIGTLYRSYGFAPGDGVGRKGRELLRSLWLQYC